jgi:peptide/nickel transport system substrate-binding protein
VAGSQELSLEKREKIYAEAQEVVSENLPFIYLVNPYSFAAVKNRFVDINYSSLRGAFWNIEKLSINDFNEEK